MELEQEQYQRPGCTSYFKNCWARLFHRAPERERLVPQQPVLQAQEPIELTDPKMAPGEVALEQGKTLWVHFINRNDPSQDVTPIDMTKAEFTTLELTYLKACYKHLNKAAAECTSAQSVQEAIEIIDKFPPKLRAILEEKTIDTVEAPLVDNGILDNIDRRVF